MFSGNEEGSSSSETASVSLSHSEDSPSQIFPFKVAQKMLSSKINYKNKTVVLFYFLEGGKLCPNRL